MFLFLTKFSETMYMYWKQFGLQVWSLALKGRLIVFLLTSQVAEWCEELNKIESEMSSKLKQVCPVFALSLMFHKWQLSSDMNWLSIK